MAITKDIPIEQTGGKGNTIQSGSPTDAKESDILEALPSEVTPKNGGDKPTNGNEVPKGNEPSKLIQKQGGEKPKTTETNGKVLNDDYWKNLYDFTVESPYIDQRLSLDDFKAKYSNDKESQKLLKKAVLNSYSHGYFPKNQYIPYPTNDEFLDNMWKEQEISNDNKVIDEVIGKDTTETVVPVDTLDVQEAPQIQEAQKDTTETTVPFDTLGVQEVRKDVTGTAVPVEILQGQEPKILQQTIKNPFYDEDAHISKHNKDMAHDPTLIFAGTKDIAVENAGREVENQREIAYQENQLEYLKREYAVGNYMRPESFESANADDYPVGSDINKEAHEKWMNDIQSTIDRLKSKDADKESQVKANYSDQYYWLSTKYDEYLNGQMTLYNYQKYENDYRMQHPDLSLDDVVKIKSEREKYFDDLRMARDINNNPEAILSVEGYQAARRLEEKAMENKTVSEINALTKSNQNEYGKQLADIKRKYDDMYSKEFSTYEKDITRKYSLLYQKAINADPTLTQLQKTYSDLYQSAQNDEDKQAILLEYNNKLTKSDAISKINKDYRYELDSRSVKLKQEIDEEYYNETEKLYKESAGKINDGIRNIVDNNYNRHINDDRNVISYVDAITKSDKFKGSDYATQKKFVELGWERFKSMVAKDLNSEYKRVPKKGEENKPYFFWTGKVKKTASELKADKASVRQRTGKMAERSFYLAAMDNMLYTKKGEPTVYQIKSMANFLLEKVKEERKRLKSDNTDLRTKIGQAEEVEIDDMGKPHMRANPEYTGDRKALSYAYFGTMQKKLGQLNTAETFLNNIIEHPENEDFFIKEQWKGFTSGSWTGYIPFIHAAADILHLADLNDITKKVQAGKPLSRLEETIFKSWGALKHLETIKPKSRWYTIGETQKVMLPYVGEFLLTSGLLTAGTEATETAMTAVIKRGITKAVEKKMIASIGEEALGIGGGEVPEQAIVKAIEKKLENKGTQTLIKTFSKVVGAVSQSSGNPQMTMQNYYERITPQVSLMLTNEGDHITARIDEKGEDFGTAIYKSYFATLADLFTETLGGDIGKLAKGTIGKLVKNPEWLKRSVLGGWMKLRGFKTSASAYKYVVEHNLGWHGIFAEYSEEFVNGRLQAMITGDKSPFDINPSDELNTIISIAGFGAGMGTVNLAHSTLTSDGNVTLTVKPSKEKGEINIKVPKSTWGKFRKMALKKGIKPSIVNEMLRAEGLTEEQQDVLKSIYATIKAKGDTDVKIDWGDVDISEEEKQDIEDASDEVKKQVEDADFEGEEPIVEEQVTEEPKPAKKENVEQPTVEQPKEEATVEEQPVEEPKSAKKGRVKVTEKEKEVEKAKETPKTKKEGKTKAKGKTEVKVEKKGKAKEKAKETPKVEQVKKEEPVGNVLDTKYEDVTIRETENGYDIYKGDEKLNARTYKTQRGVHNALSRLGDAGDISEKVSEKTKEVAKPKKKVKVAKPAKEKAKPIEKKETVSKKPIKEQIRDLENERDEKKKALKETNDISPQFAANEFGKIESEYNGKIDKLKARLETEKQTKKGKKVKKVGERAKKQIEVTKEAPVESKEEKATKSPEKQKGEKGKPKKGKPKIGGKTKIVDKSKKGKPIHEFVDADGKKRHIAYNKRKNVWEEVQYDKNVKGWRYPDKKIVGIKKNDIIDAINNKIEPSAKEAPVESKEEKATKSPKVEKGKSKSKPKISYKTKIVDKTENSDKVHEFTDADGKKRHILFNKKKRRWEEVEYNNKTKVWENPKKSSGGAGKKAVISAINWNKTKAFANVENDRQPKQKIESKWDKNTKLKDISTDDIEFESFSSHFGREHYFTLPDGTTIKIRRNPDATEIMSPIAWIVEEFSSDGKMKKEISRHPTLKEAKPAALKYADNLISEAKEPKPKTKKKTTKKNRSTSYQNASEQIDKIPTSDEGIMGFDIKKATMRDGKPLILWSSEQVNKGNMTSAEHMDIQRRTQKAYKHWKRINKPSVSNTLENREDGSPRPDAMQAGRTAHLNAFVKDVVTRLKKAFPKIEVITDRYQFHKQAKKFGFTDDMMGDLFGFKYEGKVWLNPDAVTSHTAMEEFAHIYTALMREYNPTVYHKGTYLIKDTKYMDDVESNSAYDGRTSDEKLDEALSKAIADKGEKILEKEQKYKFIKWMKQFFAKVKKALRINPRLKLTGMTLHDYTKMVANDMLNETPITSLSTEDFIDLQKGKTPESKVTIQNSIAAPLNYFDKTRSFMRYWLSDTKGTGRDYQEMVHEANSIIQGWGKRAEFKVQDFNKAIDKYIKTKYEGKSKDFKNGKKKKLLDDVNKYMSHYEYAEEGVEENAEPHVFTLDMLPDEIQEAASNMRNMINDLQRKLIKELGDWGVASSAFEADLTASIGLWVHRSYMVHDIPEYKKMYKDIISHDDLIKIHGYIRDKYQNNHLRTVGWETRKDGVKVYSFVNNSGVHSGNIIGKKTNLLGLLRNYLDVDELSELRRQVKNNESGSFELEKPTDIEGSGVDFRLTQGEVHSIETMLLEGQGKAPFNRIEGGASVGTGRFDISPLKKRKNIDEELRMLLGEYSDPRINFVKSAAKVSNLIEKGKIEYELYQQGKGIFFTQNSTELTPVRIKPSESWLLTKKGMNYTTQEVHDLLFGRERKKLTGFMRGIVAINTIAKAALTIAKDDAQARNFLGAVLNLAATGHLPTGLFEATYIATRDFDLGDNIVTSLMATPLFLSKVIGSQWVKKYGDNEASRMKFREKYLDAVSHGLTGESVIGESVEDLADRAFGDAIEGTDPKTFVSKLKSATEKTVRHFAKPYQATDAVFKVIQYDKEIDAFKKAYANQLKDGTMTMDDIKNMAAKMVRAEQPTYSNTSEFWKMVSRFPATASFVMFTVQMWKTRFAITKHIGELYRTANQSDDPNTKRELRKMAGKKSLGLVFSLLLSPMLSGISKMIYGISDEEDRAIGDTQAWYNKHNYRLYHGKDIKGQQRYFDLTFIDPASQFHKIWVALMRGEDVSEKLVGASEELLTPFVSQEIGLQAILEALHGEDEYGHKIYAEDDPAAEKVWHAMAHITGVLTPGFLTSAQKIYRGITSYTTDYGRVYSFWDELANSRFGIKQKSFRVDVQAQSRLGGEYYAILDNLKAYKEDYGSIELSDKEKQDSYEKHNGRIIQHFQMMRRYYRDLQVLGFTDDEIDKILSERIQKGKYVGTKPKRFLPQSFINALKSGETVTIDKEANKLSSSKKGGNTGSNFFNFDLGIPKLKPKL